MRVISIDPGLRGCGVAVWDERFLTFATYIRNTEEKARGMSAWFGMAEQLRAHWSFVNVLVAEVPQVYQGSKQTGDPNDLIELAGVVGAICGELQADTRFTYHPAQWKGQMPKDVCLRRIQERLLPAEEIKISLPTAASLAHNVWDAIGIGLKFLGRFEPSRAPV